MEEGQKGKKAAKNQLIIDEVFQEFINYPLKLQILSTGTPQARENSKKLMEGAL